MTKKILIPGQRYQTEIITQTRKGTDISNVQEHDLTPFYLNIVKEIDRKYAQTNVTFVNNPSPIYNCHGFTFASRRTMIWDSKEISKILSEDDYKIVENENDVQVGDIIIYFGEKGDVEHSGLVIDKKKNFPLILSKWGTGREVVHLFNNCPYDSANVRYYRISK